MKNSRFLLSFFLVSLLWTCRKTAPGPLYDVQKSVVADSGMVVTPHPLSSEVGMEILRQGGNAVDAAIAIQFAMAVVYPRAGNIGGGGFMVYRSADGKIDALDYREKAPAAATRDMYLDSLDAVIEGLSRSGALASGVPGTVAGLVSAHDRYGQLPFARLVAPAIRLARKGFQITETEANRLNGFQEAFRKYGPADSHPFLREKWSAGDRLVQPALAQTLERISEQGRAGFYEGPTADAIVAEMERSNGIITHDDLRNYQAVWRSPVTGNFRNYRIISMPPPSSGGIALVQLLKIIEPYPLANWGFHSTDAIHLMVEAERRVYADRAQHLGDSDFYKVPQEELLDVAYLEEKMASFSPATATSSDSIVAGQFVLVKESFETTHTSVIDPQGNAVSLTTTLNSNFGSKVFVRDAGFFLNNEMDDFSVKPGVPNQFGLIGAEANAIEAGKRMLSSMTPTIVEKDGRLFLVLGAPGGSTIITAVFQVIVNVTEFGMNLEEAVNAGRFHHQWLPDDILVEKGALDSLTRQELEELGHSFREVDRMAVIKAIQVLPDGRLHGVGDPRNPDDDARGF